MDLSSAIATYFHGEKNGGLILVLVAVCGISIAAILSPIRYELRAFCTTMGILALSLFALGLVVLGPGPLGCSNPVGTDFDDDKDAGTIGSQGPIG